jgi:hypothetical protein
VIEKRQFGLVVRAFRANAETGFIPRPVITKHVVLVVTAFCANVGWMMELKEGFILRQEHARYLVRIMVSVIPKHPQVVA